MKDFIYCKECVFRNDHCECTKLGLIHLIDTVMLPLGSVFYTSELIKSCEVMHVNNNDGCSFGKRRTK